MDDCWESADSDLTSSPNVSPEHANGMSTQGVKSERHVVRVEAN